MKKISVVFLLLLFFRTNAQNNFITKWYFSSPSTSLSFYVLSVGGPVNFTLKIKPSGQSVSNSVTQTQGGKITINGLTIAAGDTVILSLQPANLKRFYFVTTVGNDNSKLVDVSAWGTAKWTSMAQAFYGCENLNITATDLPDLSAVTSMNAMFYGCDVLNSPANIGSWNTASVTDMSNTFLGAAKFNQNINTWNTANVKNMSMMFCGASAFNQPLNAWNTSNVTDMDAMFSGASNFNQDISSWNTAKVTNMNSMFATARKFNQPIGKWDIVNVKSITGMFNKAAAFNQDINNWNTKNVDYMITTFDGATSFNQPLDKWNTANVSSMEYMFRDATSFNQDISAWNMAKVTGVVQMFTRARAFNQNIGNWKLNTGLSLAIGMLDSCGMDCRNYSATLIGWETNNPNLKGMSLGSKGMKYGTNAVAARNKLISTARNWSIYGDQASGTDCSMLVKVNAINNENNNFSVFPNPIAQFLNIVSENEQASTLSLLQMDGRQLAAFELPANGQLQFNTNELAPGVYLLQMQTKNGLVYTKKIVKE